MPLIKILDDDGIDITHLSIYYDEAGEQFKHKFRCPVCDMETGCVCYPSLDDAVEGTDSKWYCNRHYIEKMWYIEDLYDLISILCDNEIGTLVREYHGIDDGDIYCDKSPEFQKNEMESIMAKCNNLIKQLSDEQIDIISGQIDYDCDVAGSACEV